MFFWVKIQEFSTPNAFEDFRLYLVSNILINISSSSAMLWIKNFFMQDWTMSRWIKNILYLIRFQSSLVFLPSWTIVGLSSVKKEGEMRWRKIQFNWIIDTAYWRCKRKVNRIMEVNYKRWRRSCRGNALTNDKRQNKQNNSLMIYGLFKLHASRDEIKENFMPFNLSVQVIMFSIHNSCFCSSLIGSPNRNHQTNINSNSNVKKNINCQLNLERHPNRWVPLLLSQFGNKNRRLILGFIDKSRLRMLKMSII